MAYLNWLPHHIYLVPKLTIESIENVGFLSVLNKRT